MKERRRHGGREEDRGCGNKVEKEREAEECREQEDEVQSYKQEQTFPKGPEPALNF